MSTERFTDHVSWRKRVRCTPTGRRSTGARSLVGAAVAAALIAVGVPAAAKDLLVPELVTGEESVRRHQQFISELCASVPTASTSEPAGRLEHVTWNGNCRYQNAHLTSLVTKFWNVEADLDPEGAVQWANDLRLALQFVGYENPTVEVAPPPPPAGFTRENWTDTFGRDEQAKAWMVSDLYPAWRAAAMKAQETVSVRSAAGMLTIEVTADGKPGYEHVYSLSCPDGTGTHPDGPRACAELAWRGLPPVMEPRMCTAAPTGNGGARITGTWEGQPVDAKFSQINSCHGETWNEYAVVLGVKLGGSRGPGRTVPDSTAPPFDMEAFRAFIAENSLPGRGHLGRIDDFSFVLNTSNLVRNPNAVVPDLENEIEQTPVEGTDPFGLPKTGTRQVVLGGAPPVDGDIQDLGSLFPPGFTLFGTPKADIGRSSPDRSNVGAVRFGGLGEFFVPGRG